MTAAGGTVGAFEAGLPVVQTPTNSLQDLILSQREMIAGQNSVRRGQEELVSGFREMAASMRDLTHSLREGQTQQQKNFELMLGIQGEKIKQLEKDLDAVRVAQKEHERYADEKFKAASDSRKSIFERLDDFNGRCQGRHGEFDRRQAPAVAAEMVDDRINNRLGRISMKAWATITLAFLTGIGGTIWYYVHSALKGGSPVK